MRQCSKKKSAKTKNPFLPGKETTRTDVEEENEEEGEEYEESENEVEEDLFGDDFEIED